MQFYHHGNTFLWQISLFLQIDSYSTATAQTALDEVMGLVDLTAPQQVSIVPSDLNVAAEYVLNTVDYLLSGLENINENDTLTLLNNVSYVNDAHGRILIQLYSMHGWMYGS